MVEVGIRGDDKELKETVEKKLQQIVKDYSFTERGKRVYRGHPAMYTDTVAETLEMVQTSGGLSREKLLERKPHWHKDFKVRIARTLEEHNYMLASEILENIIKHTSEDRPVIWITPVGPMGHYPVIAEMMNKLGKTFGLKPELIFPFAMDEWADENGKLVKAPFNSYMRSFAVNMHEQFYDLLKPHARIPEENLRFAADEGLRNYVPAIQNLLKQDAGVIFTGGVGMIGHIMFWEPTYGVLLGREVSEKVTYIRGAPLTTETLAQNRFTSAASAPVPAYANTIGLGLFCMLREYGEKNPGRLSVAFGLDNAEEPLIWQRFVAQCMLAMRQTDPSFGASYPATCPGAYVVVENHLKSFKVPAK